MYQVYQHNIKRQKIEPKVHQLEKIVENNEEDERADKGNDTQCNLNEEKNNDEVNEIMFGKKAEKSDDNIFAIIFQHYWKTLYVHLSKSVQNSDLEEIFNRFNDMHNDNELQFITPKCCIFQKSYQEEAKKKRIEDVNNPNVNRYVLIKNINILESEKRIKIVKQLTKFVVATRMKL
ncbi:hypothetical protein RFI_06941 [Reticulomyxa filosa]|uniref:Uncharacterized protein n=1 Tax=Reticulomyxa filosa TaxID=46433 RepID=X6NVZ6_RETFI|nr:hypothetical protein RFI_06941 [Reticulomyxa filosa]|eukprot:ETO30181.1 hypothetical protein RFI_06941 [Reticulomyxa filosa]